MNMLKLFACGSLFALSIFDASSALSLEIIYPADGSAITRSDYLIVRLTSHATTAIEIEAQGERSGHIETAPYRAAYGDYVKLQASWLPGENVFHVYGFEGDKEKEKATAKIYFLVDPMEFVPKGFSPYEFHTPEKEKLCASCHNLRPNEDQMNETELSANPCISCHGRMLQGKFVHGPAGAFQCGSCHVPDVSSGQRFGTMMEEPDLCTNCHDDIGEQLADFKLVHGPVGAGLCTVCHSPHASDNIFQLHKPINATCKSCHDEFKKKTKEHVVRGVSGRKHPLEKKPEPARKGRELACSSCHNPHGGNVNYFFRGDPQGKMMLCMRCHPK